MNEIQTLGTSLEARSLQASRQIGTLKYPAKTEQFRATPAFSAIISPLLSIFLAVNSWAASYDVYLLAGQSNMDGMGLTNDLVGGFSVWTQPQTNVLIYYENHFLTNYVPSWQVLKPGWSGESGSGLTLSPTNFGPELTIGYVLANANPGHNIALIKVSKGGTSLAEDWSPGQDMYSDFASAVPTALGQLQALNGGGNTYTVHGMLWHQGEADYGETHDQYEGLLTNFIASVRQVLGLPGLPFVIGEINEVNPGPNFLIIRQAQYDTSQLYPNSYFVSAMNLPVQSDGLHFTSLAVLGLGQRFGSQACAFMSTASATQTWALAGSGTWSTNSAAWTTNGGNTTGAWNNAGNAAVFGPAGANPVITLSGAINAYSLTIESNAPDYTFTGGTLTVGTGGIAANQSATIGSVLLAGGTQIQSITTGQTLSVTGPMNLSIYTVNVTGNGTTTSSTAIGDVSNNPTNSAFLYDSALLQKYGNGTLVLLASNIFNGGLIIRSGTVQLGDGVSVVGSIPSNIQDYSTLTFANPSSQTYGAYLNGTGVVVKAGAGILSLTYSNSYSGGTIINGGTISISADDNLGGGGYYYNGDGFLGLNNGGMLQVTGTNDIDFGRPITLGAGGGGFSISSATNALTISSPISGNNGFVKAGAGTLTFVNSVSSTGLITVQQGTLNLASSPINAPVYVQAGATLGIGPVSGLMGQYYNIVPSDVGDSDPDFATLSSLTAALAGQTPNLWSISSAAGPNFDFGGNGANFPNPYNNNTNNYVYNLEAMYTGTFLAPTNGTYYFDTASDDGSMIWIAGNLIVSNNFTQSLTTRSGTTNLTAGAYPIVIGYYQGNGTYGFYADMALPGGSVQRLPNSMLQYGATAYTIGSLSGDPGSALNLGTFPLTVDQTSNQTFAGNISGPGGSLIKTGPADLDLSGSNSFGNATTVEAGTLTLDYTTQNNNKISPNSMLILAGGTLQVLGNLSAAFTQQVSGVYLPANDGASAIVNESGNTLLDFTSGNVSLGQNDSLNLFVTGGGGIRLPGTLNSMLGIWASTDTGDPAYLTTNNFVVPLPSYAGALPASGANAANNYLDSVGTVSASETANLLNFRDAPSLTISTAAVLQLSAGLFFPGKTALSISGPGQLGASNGLLAVNTSASLGTNALTIGAFISAGGGSLTKYGPGVLIIATNNNYTGGTVIGGGVLQVGTGGSLGNGTITDNGTLVYASANAVTLSNSVNGNGTLVQAGSNTLVIASSQEYYSNTVVNAGTLSLNVPQYTSGGYVVNGGVLLLNTPGQNRTLGTYSSVTVNSPGAVQVSNTNNVQDGEAWTINGGGVDIIGGGHQHFGALVFNGGSITTGPGSVAYDGRGNYSIDSNVTIAGSAPATLDANTGINLGAQLVGNSNVTFLVGSVNTNGADLTVTTKLTNHDGDGSPRGLVKTGPGTMMLTGACDFAGGATVLNGVLMLGHALAVQDSVISNMVNGGVAFTQTNTFNIAGLSGSGSITLTNGSGPVTLIVGSNGASTVYNGALTGSGGLDVLGGVTLTLTGSNTFSGATTISNATLSLSGYGALPNSATITVLSNATLDSSTVLMPPATVADGQTLQGAGIVNGLWAILGTLEPGPLTGTLTFSNSLAINSGATLNFALGTNGCQAAVIGNLTLGGTLNITDAGGFTNGSYKLFSYTGALTYNGLVISSRPNWDMTYTMDTTSTPGQVRLDVTTNTTLTAYQQWQFQYFGCTNCPQAATNYDKYGTGQNNLFKFVAGLNPTNPASRFVVQIAGVAGQPAEENLSFYPVATGRTYTVQFTGSLGGIYSNLTTITPPVTNPSSDEVTVTDTNATQPAKFYEIQITLP
jgi:autotransporter-associated beta strand protein